MLFADGHRSTIVALRYLPEIFFKSVKHSFNCFNKTHCGCMELPCGRLYFTLMNDLPNTCFYSSVTANLLIPLKKRTLYLFMYALHAGTVLHIGNMLTQVQRDAAHVGESFEGSGGQEEATYRKLYESSTARARAEEGEEAHAFTTAAAWTFPC